VLGAYERCCRIFGIVLHWRADVESVTVALPGPTEVRGIRTLSRIVRLWSRSTGADYSATLEALVYHGFCSAMVTGNEES
jgi:hypothetical protein